MELIFFCVKERDDLMVKINDGIIEDIRFDGEACAICTSSTSIMSELVIGKTIDEAIFAKPNCTTVFQEDIPKYDVKPK